MELGLHPMPSISNPLFIAHGSRRLWYTIPYNKDPSGMVLSITQASILLGGSWDLVSPVISTLIGVIRN